METDLVSETLCFPVFRVKDCGQSPDTQWFWTQFLFMDLEQRHCLDPTAIEPTNRPNQGDDDTTSSIGFVFTDFDTAPDFWYYPIYMLIKLMWPTNIEKGMGGGHVAYMSQSDN
jgi:hypothetical protein